MSLPRILRVLLLATLLLTPPATAQDASPVPGDVQREQVASITLPAAALQPVIEAISWEELRVEPGVNATLTADARFQARVMVVLSGSVTLTLPGESMVWRGDAAPGGDPEPAPPGKPFDLATGDVVAIPATDGGSGAKVHIANPGAAPDRIGGIHFSEAPLIRQLLDVDGIRTISRPLRLLDAIDPSAGNLTLRLDRLVVEPSQQLQPDAEAIAAFYEVDEGVIEYAWTPPDGATTFTTTWAPVMGGWFPWANDVAVSLMPSADEPAVVLELTVTQD